jgi:ribosome-binding factor A
MSQRTERVDELLRQEIGAILAREVADPRIGFATITDVETTPDLRHARVWVSVIGQPEERAETLRALGRAMPFVRHQLGLRLRIKRIPELHLREDDSAERGTRVLRLLADLEAGVDPDAEEPLEPLPTPVARLPHEGDAPEAAEAAIPEAPAPEERSRRRGGVRGRSGIGSARRSGRR